MADTKFVFSNDNRFLIVNDKNDIVYKFNIQT